MNRLNLTVIATAIGLALGASAFAANLSKTDYKAAKHTIAADYKGLKASCEPLSANAKDVCMAEAKGKEQVALAELQASYKPTDKTRTDVVLAKAHAAYAVAKEKCDDLAGNAKDVCLKEANATYTAAKADAKAHKKTVAANKDAREDKRDAEYAVAKEKCDSLAGTPKDNCLNDAKARFGKS